MGLNPGSWQPLVAGVGYALLGFGAIVFTRAADGVATIWLANAYLLGLLVRAPAGSGMRIALAGAAGCEAAALLGHPAPPVGEGSA